MTVSYESVVVFLCFATLFVLLVLIVSLIGRVLTLLRDNHNDKWVSLGKPTLIANNSIRNSVSIFRFIVKREFEGLSDPQISITCRVLVWAIVAYFVAVLSLVILFVFLVLRS